MAKLAQDVGRSDGPVFGGRTSASSRRIAVPGFRFVDHRRHPAVAPTIVASRSFSEGRAPWLPPQDDAAGGSVSENATGTAAAPHKGKYLSEGDELPIAQDDIEIRLSSRTRLKTSSAALFAQTSSEAPSDAMFGPEASDLVADKYSETRVDELGNVDSDHFQDVYRRMRRTGRDSENDRDASDAMLKVIEYTNRMKESARVPQGVGGTGKEPRVAPLTPEESFKKAREYQARLQYKALGKR